LALGIWSFVRELWLTACAPIAKSDVRPFGANDG